MTKMNISDIINLTESTIVEFKEEINSSTFKTIAAFVNTEGGTLFAGISDDKEIKGIDCSNNFIEDLTNKIVNKIGIHPKIECIDAKGKKILIIEVTKSTLPVSFNGKYYKRVGNTTRKMQEDELRSFLLKGTNWDALTGDYSFDDIDKETVRKFVHMAIRSGRLSSADEKDDFKETFEKLKLVIDGKLTNAAVMLFGKDPRKYFINAVVRVGRFKDETTIIGDRLIEGNLFKQAVEAEEAMKNFINVRYEITGEELARKSIWDYPLEALREALLNAIVHRDYFKFNVQTQIKIFDDYIWFFNIGNLPEGITLEQLKGVHPSVARNPLIVHIFYLAGLIEEYGSGIGRILDSFNEAEIPEPDFKEEFGGFSIYMKKEQSNIEKFKELGLNERQEKAIKYLLKQYKITNRKYREINPDITDRTALNDLNQLIEKNIIIAKGGKKNRHYVISDKFRINFG